MRVMGLWFSSTSTGLLLALWLSLQRFTILINAQSPVECLSGLSKSGDKDGNSAIDWTEYQVLLMEFARDYHNGCTAVPDISVLQTQFDESACSCQEYVVSYVETTTPCLCLEPSAAIAIPSTYPAEYSINICQAMVRLVTETCAGFVASSPASSATAAAATAPVSASKSDRNAVPGVLSALSVVAVLAIGALVWRRRRANKEQPALINGLSKHFILFRGDSLRHDDAKNVSVVTVVSTEDSFDKTDTEVTETLEEGRAVDWHIAEYTEVASTSGATHPPDDSTQAPFANTTSRSSELPFIVRYDEESSGESGKEVQLARTTTLRPPLLEASSCSSVEPGGQSTDESSNSSSEEDNDGSPEQDANGSFEDDVYSDDFDEEEDDDDDDEICGPVNIDDAAPIGPIDIDEGRVLEKRLKFKSSSHGKKINKGPPVCHRRKKGVAPHLRSVKGVRAAYMEKARSRTMMQLKPIPEATLTRGKKLAI